ncbi:adhesion G-protein coupled receptor G2 [Clarias magur]|uniref:Adhesion G-protein coupled receptor G2 n=1 Tax=Clarias magur TaxID=1594786 RepID=A0A8J4WPB5_CLAMG|nr:adhesion G-protein coupled receptor G2 [Clarias magur]
MGKWMAFSYAIPRSPSYELALQGDRDAVYAWLQGVQHRFPVRLAPERWHRLCLRIDSVRKRFSLSVNGSKVVHERMVVVKALRPSGSLQLGFHPWEVCPGSSMAAIELHLFRVWGDAREHSDCEDGTIVGWDSNLWKTSRGQTWVQDNTLSCTTAQSE